MSSPATISVNDDLPASETSITMRSANDEATRWVKMEDCLLIKVLLGNDRLDDMLLQVSSNLIVGDCLIMLGRDEDGVDTDRDPGTALIAVLKPMEEVMRFFGEEIKLITSERLEPIVQMPKTSMFKEKMVFFYRNTDCLPKVSGNMPH